VGKVWLETLFSVNPKMITAIIPVHFRRINFLHTFFCFIFFRVLFWFAEMYFFVTGMLLLSFILKENIYRGDRLTWRR